MKERNLRLLSETSIPDSSEAKPLCCVYDTEAYSYADILAQLTSHHRGTARLGTYHPRTADVITESEVFE